MEKNETFYALNVIKVVQNTSQNCIMTIYGHADSMLCTFCKIKLNAKNLTCIVPSFGLNAISVLCVNKHINLICLHLLCNLVIKACSFYVAPEKQQKATHKYKGLVHSLLTQILHF